MSALEVTSTPTIAADGATYLTGGGIHALSPDGTLLWTLYTGCEDLLVATSP